MKTFEALGLETDTSVPVSVAFAGGFGVLALLALFSVSVQRGIGRKPPLMLLCDNAIRQRGRMKRGKAFRPEPDAAEWWPLLLVALGVTFLLTFALERGHDVRLILLGVLALVAAGTSFTVTTGLIEQDLLDRAADYWPLLVTALGIGLLPLAFRRRAR